MARASDLLYSILRWFDAEAGADRIDSTSTRLNWIRIMPFIGLHLGCLGVIWVGVSPFAVWFALGFFVLRMFAITGFYHRYFAHKTFSTNRFWQFVFAVIGASAVQRGPLWWAAHHRYHHQHSDTDQDLHSPEKQGFWWSHVGWFTCDAAFLTDYRRVGDWARYPELKFLNRFDAIVPLTCLVGIYALGEALAVWAPSLGTSGAQLTIWGFFISTVAVFHGTVSINSLAHVWGHRRFQTSDDSRNNFWLALLTLGEGWHNNHHRWPTSARQGFRWWEVDITFYLLWTLEKIGIISNLKPIPKAVYKETLERDRQRYGHDAEQ
ncbi:acyl-CoA desaturase [Halomonadaceae bacterium KBTZ08]